MLSSSFISALFLLLVLLPFVSPQTFYSTSSGNNIINVCHCDLTQNFCDYNCCCDSDCAPSIITALKQNNLQCKTNSLLTYCLDPSYFAWRNIQYKNMTEQDDGTVCYDFDNTKNDQPQITLTTRMRETITNQSRVKASSSSTNQSYYSNGYNTSKSFLTISEALAKNGGLCTDTDHVTSFNFNVDRSITCTATTTDCQASASNIFKPFLSKTIQTFKDESQAENITTQSSLTYSNANNQCLTKLTLIVFYAKLGIQNDDLPYIIDTRMAESYGSGTARTVEIKFVDYRELQEEVGLWSIIGAPFFPMIPQDMFYPLIYNHGEIVKRIVGVGMVIVMGMLL